VLAIRKEEVNMQAVDEDKKHLMGVRIISIANLISDAKWMEIFDIRWVQY